MNPRLSTLCLAILFVAGPLSAQQGMSPLDSLIQVYEQSDPDLADIELLTQISLRFTDVDPVEGLRYGNMALELANSRGIDDYFGEIYNCLGSNYLMVGNVDTSIALFIRAKDVYEVDGNIKGMADIAGNLGHIKYYTGRFAEALEYYFESLFLFEEIGYVNGIANQHLSIGNVYMNVEKLDDAMYHDSIALKMFQEVGDPSGQALVLGNMGNIYAAREEWDKAEVYHTQTLELYEEMQMYSGVGRTMVNLSLVNESKGDYLKALEMAERGLEICQSISFPQCIMYSLGNVGAAYLSSYETIDTAGSEVKLVPGTKPELLANAILYLEQAAAMIPEGQLPEESDEVYRLLAKAYAYNGDYEAAFEQHKTYVAVHDSLLSQARTNRIEFLTTEREIAVRDKQIELDTLRLKVKKNERVYFGAGLVLLAGLLIFIYRNFINQKKSNIQLGILNGRISEANLQLEEKNVNLSNTLQELKETQDQLIESERQKENEILRRRISRDIHDDISSGLTKISWMTEVMKSRAGGDGATVDNKTLEKIAGFARDTVSKLGEIIWSTKPESDNVESLLSYMRQHLNAYLEGLDMQYEIDFPADPNVGEINPELRRNIYLVMKEAVHNAAKYSEASMLNVSFRIDGNNFTLEVRDNGKGIGDNGHTGNGLRNMKARMQNVGGDMAIDTSPDRGTALTFTGEFY